MKSLIILAALLSSSLSFAMAKCPAESTTVAACNSTPAPGDNEFAGNLADSIAICKKGTKTLLVIEKDGESNSGPAKVTQMMGGTSYSVKEDTVLFNFSIPQAVNPQAKPHAKLSITFTQAAGGAGLSGSTTYTCK